jgi:hypothetical protein
MYPSSALCRVQEALQRDRAAGAVLDNVRMIAVKAATAWGIEAVQAEAREERQKMGRSRLIASVFAVEKHHSCDLDRTLSENPDRGLESA